MPLEAPANLPNCATFCRAGGAQQPHAQAGQGSPAPAVPRSHPVLLSTPRSTSSMDAHPSQAEPGVCPDPRLGDENARLILHLPSHSWPRAQSQRVGLKKDQSLAEVSARPIFIQGRKLLILKAAWIRDHEGDALRLHQQEGSCAARTQTSTLGNASVQISKMRGKKGRKHFLPERSIKPTITTAQETLQRRALGKTS